MHELAIVMEIIETIQKEAASHKLAHVKRTQLYESPPCPACGDSTPKVTSGQGLQLVEIEGE